MKQAVILAGGKGTRLAEVSGGLPKPLVPVAGTAIIVRQLALLARYGVKDVFVTTGFKADALEAQLGSGDPWGLSIHYVHEEEPLGTAGGVAALASKLKSDFFVLYGDVMVNMDLAKLATRHTSTGADATIVVHPNDHPHDSDLVSCDDEGWIDGFHPYPRDEGYEDLANLVSAALYVLSPSVFAHIEAEVKQDFVRDVFPRLLTAGRLQAYNTTEYLKDMGTPERLAKVERDVESGRVEQLHADFKRPMLFTDRDGVINREIGGVHQPEKLELLPESAAALRMANQAGWLVGLATNQPDIAKGFFCEADLRRVHNRLEVLLGKEGAWLDAIEYCPHHPDRGFEGERIELKVECDCRKPGPGLLIKLAARLPVDVERSVMVGDQWRDIVAAHQFGIPAIGVRSGDGLQTPAPERFAELAKPDLIVDDLAAAVRFVTADEANLASLSAKWRQSA